MKLYKELAKRVEIVVNGTNDESLNASRELGVIEYNFDIPQKLQCEILPWNSTPDKIFMRAYYVPECGSLNDSKICEFNITPSFINNFNIKFTKGGNRNNREYLEVILRGILMRKI